MTVWIDTDMGFDDLWAVQMVVDRMEVAGLSLTFGNTPRSRVVDNAARAMAFAGWPCPVHVGADRAILGGRMDATHVLGPTGMASLDRQLPEAPALPASEPALAAIVGWLETLAKPATILAIGPLTNIAVLALARPDLLDMIERLIWMGGSAGAGNQTASAEFNAAADPEALAIVIDHDLPLRMIDLELCRQVLISPADISRLSELPGPRETILADLAGGYVDIAISRGRKAMALYDPVAAVALMQPALFEFVPVHLDVELAGSKTRGRTIVNRRQGQRPNAEIGVAVDADEVRRLALEALLNLAKNSCRPCENPS